MFARAGISVIDLGEAGVPFVADEDAIEMHDTFEANALAKARYFSRLTGRPAVADDSGLEVVALGGHPGVRSKRWGAEHNALDGAALVDANNGRLVASLRDVTERRARFVSVAAFVFGGIEHHTRGETEGTIVDQPRGTGGFGYDPYFLSSELGLTFGEASLESKERISARGRALREMIAWLRTHEATR